MARSISVSHGLTTRKRRYAETQWPGGSTKSTENKVFGGSPPLPSACAPRKCKRKRWRPGLEAGDCVELRGGEHALALSLRSQSLQVALSRTCPSSDGRGFVTTSQPHNGLGLCPRVGPSSESWKWAVRGVKNYKLDPRCLVLSCEFTMFLVGLSNGRIYRQGSKPYL